MVRRYRANGVDYLAHADQHAAGGLDPVTGGGGGGSGTPATTVVAETGYGQGTAVGVATNYAREDHSHGSPALGATAATAAAGNHTHTANPALATNALVLGTAAAAGVAATTLRSDDTIAAFDATVPVTQAFGDAAAAGAVAFAARRDHRHGMPANPAPAFVTPALVLGSAAAAGAAATVIRSDATIAAFDATVPTTLAFGGAAAVGTAAFAARRDHAHGMPLEGLELLGTTVLGANAATTATVILSAIRNEIWIVYRVVGYSAGDIASFRFGNATIDTGNNYYTRYITVAAGGVTLVNVATNSTNGLRVAGNSQTTGRSGLIIISNLAASEKIASVMDFCGSGAVATSPAMNLCGGGAWVNTTQQLDRLLMLAIGGQSLLAGSGFTVYGKNM